MFDMQVNNNSFISHYFQRPEEAQDFENKLLGAIFYGNCQSALDNAIKPWALCVPEEHARQIGDLIDRLKREILETPAKALAMCPVRVRLKGQEKLHFHDRPCTLMGYYDDFDDHCILEDSLNTKTPAQEYGYQEVDFNLVEPKMLYTLGLGPCIGILMVGIRSDGSALATLMHEDYSEPEGSVTDMFDHSFKTQEFKEIKCFLIGGNGGEDLTRKRFDIHKAEILELKRQHGDLIDLVRNSNESDSTNDKYMRDESHVFLASIESSLYLFILHENQEKNITVESVCINGPGLSVGELASYYQANILPLR